MAIQLGLPFIYSLFVYIKILRTVGARTRTRSPNSRLYNSAGLTRRRIQEARHRYRILCFVKLS